MEEIVVPARVKITRELDVHGLPITRATLDVGDEVGATPLPRGRPGTRGPRGRPRATWIKSGEVETAAELPDDLGPDDRGKWWHERSTNDMLTWDGSQWIRSRDAVGPAGPVAPGSNLRVVETQSSPRIRVAGASIVAGESMRVVVPAGERGPQGPRGIAGPILESQDFDPTSGLADGATFAWARNGRRFRMMPPVNGVGPWSAGPDDIAPDSSPAAVNLIELASITVPPLPFAWRPWVHGIVQTLGGTKDARPHVFARLDDWNGPPVGHGRQSFGSSLPLWVNVTPYYSDQRGAATLGNSVSAQRVSPLSEFGVVAANTEATIYFRVERLGTSSTNDGSGPSISHRRDRAYFQVHAMPVQML